MSKREVTWHRTFAGKTCGCGAAIPNSKTVCEACQEAKKRARDRERNRTKYQRRKAGSSMMGT